MTFGKTSSLLVTTLLAMVLATIPLGAAFGLWPIVTSPTLAIVFASVTAMLGGLAFYVIIGAHVDTQMRRLAQYFASIENETTSIPPAPSGRWLGKLPDAAARTLRGMRRRVDELAGQRRELEIQCRVSDSARRHAQSILQSISDAVLVTDPFNEVAIANEAAAQAMGFEADQAVHQPLEKVVRDATLVRLIKDTRESANLSNRRHFEHAIGDNGRARIYDVTLSCMANQQDEVSGVVTILRDVTREKEVSAMKSDFVSSVSHELRTPLSSIKAYVEMLVDGEAADEQTRAEFYNVIQSETNRLSRLIDNILNISRIESGVVKIQRENVSLPMVIREVMDVMLPQARAKQIELVDQPSPLFFQVYADKDMVYQALLNLVGNAIKYTPEGGTVMVRLDMEEQGQFARIQVSDTGMGIPADAIDHVFDKFYRVNGHKKVAKGTGLGLNLVKHIVETVHGGKVAVDSQENQGSTFTIALPVADAVPA